MVGFFRLFRGQTGGPLVNGDFDGAGGTLKISFFIFWNGGGMDISWFYVEKRFVRNFLPDISFHRNVPLKSLCNNYYYIPLQMGE